MGSVVELYEALASAPDERARARVIAGAFEGFEERYPHLPDLVTHQQAGSFLPISLFWVRMDGGWSVPVGVGGIARYSEHCRVGIL